MRDNEFTIEGKNEIIEAFRAGKSIDRLFLLDGARDGTMQTIKREAKKHSVRIDFVDRARLDQLSP
ncbi:MAG: 23S rRNA (guanosine(2251)-2'-O)-methyltransferase RlmB, partial [Lachnospiraceae bacterium]|nr:23S rRNA (guanosine(2251)-2'-O)-methyltransferase RlmB [Lachnospiraceae bacterium]